MSRVTTPLLERPEFTIRIAETKDEVEACYDIRVEVFVVEQGFSIDNEIDQYDPISRHFLLSVTSPSSPDRATSSITAAEAGVTSRPVGTIRFTPSDGKVSRLAVLGDYRKYGFGRELMRALIDHARSGRDEDIRKVMWTRNDGREIIKLKLHSQMQVVSWYQRFNFQPEGEPFDEDGAPHQKMVLEIELDQTARGSA